MAVAHECDLALLSVEDESFFNDLKPLDIMSDLPQLQDPVLVLGYPEGGDTVSFTQGVVSRIEVLSYVHSYNDLLALQIDAAINPGNSGGPVFINIILRSTLKPPRRVFAKRGGVTFKQSFCALSIAGASAPST